MSVSSGSHDLTYWPDSLEYITAPAPVDPQQMEGFHTYYYEYHFLYITGIEHVESKSIQGASLMELVFHSGTDMSQAMAQVVGYVNRARAFMPPGAVWSTTSEQMFVIRVKMELQNGWT